MGDTSLGGIAYSTFSESDESALRWFIAGAGNAKKIKLPITTRTHTPGSFRRAKLRKAFWGTFVVTGLIGLIAIVLGVLAASRATSWDDARRRLADVPIISAVLIGGHLFFTGVMFLMLGGLGGSHLANPDEKLAIRATSKELTLTRGNDAPLTGPWNTWRIGAVETETVYEGTPTHIVRALEFVRIDLAGLRMGGYLIRPDHVLRGERLIPQLVVCMLKSQRSGAPASAAVIQASA